MSLKVSLLLFNLALAAFATESADGLRGGVEIAVQIPLDLNPKFDAPAAFVDQLKTQGFEVIQADRMSIVKDPKTKAVFFISKDGAAVEIRTPPMYAAQAETILAPIFKASEKLGWQHTTGGGHIHLNMTELAKEPTKFVNMLVGMHNNPVAERLFLPVEGEPTLFQRGRQADFMKAVEDYRKIKNPSWTDVERLFSPLYNEKPGSILFHDNTVEIRAIGNQKYPKAAALEIEFYEKLWGGSSGAKVDDVVAWTREQYVRQLAPENIKKEAEFLFGQYGLVEDDYANFINDFGKTRRRAMERAVQANSIQAIDYLSDEKQVASVLEINLRGPRFTEGKQAALMYMANMDWFRHSQLREAILVSLGSEEFLERPFAFAALQSTDWGANASFQGAVLDALDEADLRTMPAVLDALRGTDWTKLPKIRAKIVALATGGSSWSSAALRVIAETNWVADKQLREIVLSAVAATQYYSSSIALDAIRNVDWRKDERLRAAVIAALGDKKPALRLRAANTVFAVDWKDDPQLREKILEMLHDADDELVEVVSREVKSGGIDLSARPDRQAVVKAHGPRADTGYFPDSYIQYSGQHGCAQGVLEALRAEVGR